MGLNPILRANFKDNMFSRIYFKFYCWCNSLCPIHLRLCTGWPFLHCGLCEQELVLEYERLRRAKIASTIRTAKSLKEMLK